METNVVYEVRHDSEFSFPSEIKKRDAFWLIRYLEIKDNQFYTRTHPEPIAMFNYDSEARIFQKFLDDWKGKMGKANV